MTEIAGNDLNNGGSQSSQLVAASENRPAEPGYSRALAANTILLSPTEAFSAKFRDFLRILFKHRWLALTIIVAIVVVGAFRTMMETPEFTSIVRLQVDRDVTKVLENGDTTPTEIDDFEYMRTQYELLQSRSIAERTVSMLKLGDDPNLIKPKGSIFASIMRLFSLRGRGVALPSQAERDQAATNIILDHRAVVPVTGSRLVDIKYSDPSPERAQRVAKGLADAFIASTIDKKFEANAFAKTFLADQLKQLQLRLQDSEKAVLDFGQREHIVETNDKSSIAEANLASANEALSSVVAERIKNEQLWKQVESIDAISFPQFLSNPAIEALRNSRDALVTDFQEKLETFKPSYPAMVEIKNKINEIDLQIGAEVQTIKDSLKAAYDESLNQEAEMKRQIALLSTQALDLQKRSIEYNILKREADTNRNLYDSLLQRYKEVDVAGGMGLTNVFIVEKAEIPRVPSSPLVMRDMLISLALGVCAGIGAALLLERLDDTLSSVEEAERVTGLATVGVIPKLDPAQAVEDELADLRSAMSEAYRTLCTSLHFATEGGLPKTLCITSSAPAEGKSTTAIAVARHFASMGMHVLLIDADLRKPSLHQRLGLDNSKGLTNYLTGGATPPEVFQQTSVPNLTFMASGPVPPNAVALLSSPRLLSLLSVGMEVFGLIIIDGPPVMELADAQVLSSAAAGTVFIVAAGMARKNMIRGSLRRLQFARGAIIGSVLTYYDAKTANYGYAYGYGYGYGYGGYGYGHRYGTETPPAMAASQGQLAQTSKVVA